MRMLFALAALLLLTAAGLPPEGRVSVEQLRAKYMTSADRLVTIGGVEVRYRDEGRGPAILLLHGSNSTLETWDGVAARLKRNYRVIRFDHPPMGLSGGISDAAKTTLTGPVPLMTGLLDRLGVSSVVAVGTSSGGTMAYYLAGARPDMVRGLVVSNAPSQPLDNGRIVQPPDLVAALAREKATGLKDRDWFRVYFRWLYGRPARVTEAQIERGYDFGRRTEEGNFLHLFALGGNGELTREMLGKVKAPTLIIWGMTDTVLPWDAAVSLRDKLTSVRPSMALLDDVGHYPPIEAPERYAALVETFLTQVVPLE